jgi:hypothetical protein
MKILEWILFGILYTEAFVRRIYVSYNWMLATSILQTNIVIIIISIDMLSSDTKNV